MPPTGKAAWRQEQQARLKENELDAVLAELPALGTGTNARRGGSRPSLPPLLEQPARAFGLPECLAAKLADWIGRVNPGYRYVIQARLKRSGTWWKEENAEKRLALRINQANCEWESYWQRQRQGAG